MSDRERERKLLQRIKALEKNLDVFENGVKANMVCIDLRKLVYFELVKDRLKQPESQGSVDYINKLKRKSNDCNAALFLSGRLLLSFGEMREASGI